MTRVYLCKIIPVLLLPPIFLSGCAGDMAYRDGKRLIEEGKVEEGLIQLERATMDAPDDLKFKSYYFLQRDVQINQLLIRADSTSSGEDYDVAESLYRRVLTIDPGNVRASEGIEAMNAARRHKTLLAEAESLLKKEDAESARGKLHVILVENQKHVGARKLLRRIEEKDAEDHVRPILKSSLHKPITLEFREASLNAVFEFISRAASVNFMLDKDVRPDIKINLFLKDVEIEDAIQFLLTTNQLEKKVLNDNTLLIYPNTSAKNKDYQALITRSFYLSNSDVKQTANLIKTLVKSKDVFIDEKLNMLVIRDTPEAVHFAEKLVALHDLAEPEVTLAVEVLEVSSNRLAELGIRYPSHVSYSVAGATGVPGQLTLNEFQKRNAGLVNMAVTDPLLIASLQDQDGESHLLANPRIRVKNREKAKVHIGDRVPVITSTSTSTGFVSESVNYLDVGLKLDVEPDISLENEVSIKIGLEVSNIVSEVASKNGTLTYRLGTRNASTVLRLKDGETQILAGLISNEERDSADKVPGLGDLPLLGRLFSNHKNTKNKSEIILLVTPHIVRNINQPDITTTEFPSGTDASIGAPSLLIRQEYKNISAIVPMGSPPVLQKVISQDGGAAIMPQSKAPLQEAILPETIQTPSSTALPQASSSPVIEMASPLSSRK